MTIEEVQLVLTAIIGAGTLWIGWSARRLAGLQAAAAIEPDVSIDLRGGFVARAEEPLNIVDITNHSPLELDHVVLKAEISVTGLGVTVDRYLGFPPTLLPQARQAWCIDEVIDEAMEVAEKHSPGATTPDAEFHPSVRLIVDYRRKTDGAPFRRDFRLEVVAPLPEARPMAVYPQLRPSRQASEAGSA